MDKLSPLGLLLLRLGLAIIFFYHGYPKLTHTRATMQVFSHMGFPSYFAYISGVLEVFCSVLLAIGLFTRVAGLLLAIEMGVALWRVHLPMGGIYAVNKYELPLAVGVGAFALATTGAGMISLDRVVFGKTRGAARRPKSKA